MDIEKLNHEAVNKAVERIKEGGVVIFPTDTVYGFLADASNKKAINKIYKIKKRPRSKPLAVFVKDFKMANELAEIDPDKEKILTLRLGSGRAKYWPGKYTFVLPSLRGAAATKQSKLILGKNNTIALRIPKYKPLNNLLKKINKPLAQTSVNISSQPPLTKIKDIIFMLKNCAKSDLTQFLIIDGGDLPKKKPSRIIDLTGKVLTRVR